MQFIKESFWSLLSKSEITNITIPIIQRAYTQGGRSGDTKIEEKGQKFLNRLVLALKDTSKPVMLDFIYGSEGKNKDKILPLDGQQRLTTLFLLHWYLAQKEDKLTESMQTLKKFTYETRQSSRYFCEHLCNYKITTRKESLNETIKNEKWFMLSWKNDPSICSMLGMLDKIDTALKDDTNSYWDILITDIEICPITFFYTSLEKLTLTDDLYIKMNARGLELTDFEKLKAAFNQKIDDNNWESDKIDKPAERFGHKIDTVWTDLFWKYKDKFGLIDNELLNFIAGIAINCYAKDRIIAQSIEEKVKKELAAKGDVDIKTAKIIYTRIKQLSDNSALVCPDDFDTLDSYNHLVNSLNVYADKDNNFDKLKPRINLWSNCATTLFGDLLYGKEVITQPKRVLFFAQTEYLLNNNNLESEHFDNWMRVCRNLVENATVGSWTDETMINLIKILKKWATNSSDIYQYLSIQSNYSGVAKEQVEEEFAKARQIWDNTTNSLRIKDIASGQTWKEEIIKAEDTQFFKGRIRDLEDFAWTDFKADRFEKWSELVCDNDQEDLDITRRALLTRELKDYPKIFRGYTNYCFCWEYSDWKAVISDNKTKFKEFLDDIIQNTQKDEREMMIADYSRKQPKDWYFNIIKYPELLRYCEYKNVQENTDLDCWNLIKGKVVGAFGYKTFAIEPYIETTDLYSEIKSSSSNPVWNIYLWAGGDGWQGVGVAQRNDNVYINFSYNGANFTIKMSHRDIKKIADAENLLKNKLSNIPYDKQEQWCEIKGDYDTIKDYILTLIS